MKMQTLVSSFLTVLILVLGSNAVADEKPSGTVTITEKQIGFLLSGDWGHGTLTFNGEPHMFHMGGGKLGGIGVSSMHVDGAVYNLKSLDDFEGVYFKADAALTVAKGKGGSWLKNSNGVVMHLGADSEGLMLGIGAGGLKISF